jgi:hypothetical protein
VAAGISPISHEAPVVPGILSRHLAHLGDFGGCVDQGVEGDQQVIRPAIRSRAMA